MKRYFSILLAIVMIITCCPIYGVASAQTTDFMLESFDSNFDTTQMNPNESGYGSPIFSVTTAHTEDGGEGMKAEWNTILSDGSPGSALFHQMPTTADWSKTTFAQKAADYDYLRLWFSNPTEKNLYMMTRLFTGNTKVHFKADQVIMTRSDGSVMTTEYGSEITDYELGCYTTIHIPANFEGWIAYPIDSVANTNPAGSSRPALTSFSDVTQIELDVRLTGSTTTTGYYYVLDNMVLSDEASGTSRSSGGPTPTTPTNIALSTNGTNIWSNYPTSENMTNAGWGIANMIDGNDGNVAGTDMRSDNQYTETYIDLNFNKMYEVSKIRLRSINNGTFPRDYTLNVWTADGWKEVARETDYATPEDNAWVEYTFDPESCSAVRLAVTENGSDGSSYYIGLREFEVYGVESSNEALVPSDTLMLEDFTDYTDFTVMNPQDNGYALPTFQLTDTGVDEGDALQVNWASTDTVKSYAHQMLPDDVWAHQTFAQHAEKYTYLRMWVNNPTFITLQLTVRLYSDNTKVYMNADHATLSRKDGTVMTHITGDATGAGENSSLEIPSGFSGWVAYPINLDATTGARGRENLTSFSEVNQIEIDVRRPETYDKNSYYILDDICLSRASVGTLQSFAGNIYDPTEGKPFETDLKNVIVLVGDGMGQTILQATRDYKNDALYMDGMEYKSTVISSNNVYDELTDSSAGGTALSCGVRTVNGHVALDADGMSVENMVEFFTRAGKETGIVTTSYLLDATPTTFGSRGMRGSSSTLGQGLFENNISVLLGGGKDYFNSQVTHDGQKYTLLEYAEEIYGYTYVDHASELREFDGDKVLGVFGAGYMDYEVDRDDSQMSIAEMTDKAISLLENEDGFFLMVEGGNIDHAAHANDLNRTITDTLAFDDAVQVALDYMKEHPDTLVVVCADHSTGGLKGENNSYSFTTNDHDMSLTACFASGMGAEYFTGLGENADIALAVRRAAMEAEQDSADTDSTDKDTVGDDSTEDGKSEGEKAEDGQTERPITGDANAVGVFLVLALVGASAIYVVIRNKRKHLNLTE